MLFVIINICKFQFQVENMNKNSCIVDLRKLEVFNHSYIVEQLSKDETASELIKKLRSILKDKYGCRYVLIICVLNLLFVVILVIIIRM